MRNFFRNIAFGSFLPGILFILIPVHIIQKNVQFVEPTEDFLQSLLFLFIGITVLSSILVYREFVRKKKFIVTKSLLVAGLLVSL